VTIEDSTEPYKSLEQVREAMLKRGLVPAAQVLAAR
jgi:hypothetical protein